MPLVLCFNMPCRDILIVPLVLCFNTLRRDVLIVHLLLCFNMWCCHILIRHLVLCFNMRWRDILITPRVLMILRGEWLVDLGLVVALRLLYVRVPLILRLMQMVVTNGLKELSMLVKRVVVKPLVTLGLLLILLSAYSAIVMILLMM